MYVYVTINNISVIYWWSVFLCGGTWRLWWKPQTSSSHKSLTNFWMEIKLLCGVGIDCILCGQLTYMTTYVKLNLTKQNHPSCYLFISSWVRVMVLNTTFNNISAIPWWSVLLVEETGVPRDNHRPTYLTVTHSTFIFTFVIALIDVIPFIGWFWRKKLPLMIF